MGKWLILLLPRSYLLRLFFALWQFATRSHVIGTEVACGLGWHRIQCLVSILQDAIAPVSHCTILPITEMSTIPA